MDAALYRMMVAMFVMAVGGSRDEAADLQAALGKYQTPVTVLQAWDQLETAWAKVTR